MLGLCKRQSIRVIAILSSILIMGAFIFWFIFWKNPIKYALKEDEFDQYSNYILVREVHYTGTGWTIIGDENGYLPDDLIVDVVLKGEKLPEAKAPADRYNTFLCIVEYVGMTEHMAYAEQLRCYEVKEWYPVYPVVRNSLLPQKFYPQNYMTENDINEY